MVFIILPLSYRSHIQDEMLLTQRQKASLESEIQRTEDRIRRCIDDKNELQEKFDELKKKADNEERNFTLLKESCSVMDDQLRVLFVFKKTFCLFIFKLNQCFKYM